MKTLGAIDLELRPLPTGLRLYREGGISLIYEHPTDPDLFIKVFTDSRHNPDPVIGDRADHIKSLTTFGQGVSKGQALRLQESFSWPVEIFGASPNEVDGIAIRRAPNYFWIELGRRELQSNSIRRKKVFQDFSYLMTDYLNRPIIVETPYREISFDDRVELSRELLLAMKTIWELGYRYCDYKPYNLAWSIRPRPQVFVIDADSVEKPNRPGLHSPAEWAPLEHLDETMESDRSLCARTMWRIIAGDMGSTPNVSRRVGNTRFLDDDTVKLFERAHQFGLETDLDDLLNDLGRYRSKSNSDLGFDWAVSTNLASVVFAYAPLSPTPEQAAIIRMAEVQIERENSLKALAPMVRTLRLSRMTPEAGFIWDIPDVPSDVSAEFGDNPLRAQALKGQFEAITVGLLGSGLPEESSRLFRRSAQVALARVGQPPLAERTDAIGVKRVDWSWPGGTLVQGAAIRVFNTSTGDLMFESFADKSRNRPSMRLPEAEDDRPVRCSVSVSYAVVTSSGEEISCPVSSTLMVDLLPRRSESRWTSRPVGEPSSPPRPSIETSPRTFIRAVPAVTESIKPVPQSGWYPDPSRQYEERYFDGAEFTSLVRQRGREFEEGNDSRTLLARIINFTSSLSRAGLRRH